MTNAELEEWLQAFVRDNGAVAGTVHIREADVLSLRAALNIPPKVQEVVRSIPLGKGMAGLAWERDAPVHTCNLKTDETGDVRPGAKAVDANAAVALPVHDAIGEVRGVVGIAYLGERTITDRELEQLRKDAEQLPE